MDKNDHLEQARIATKELVIERYAAGGTTLVTLQADQGRALRTVVYHGFAAVVEAIDEFRRQTS
jgi:hypothetical protein